MLDGLNKDYREEDVGNGFVRPFADEYEDEESSGEEREDQPFWGNYDDEDYQNSGREDDFLHGKVKANSERREEEEVPEDGRNKYNTDSDFVFEETHTEEEHQEWSREGHQGQDGGESEEKDEALGQGWNKKHGDGQGEGVPGRGWSVRPKEEQEGRGWSRKTEEKGTSDDGPSEETPRRGWSAEIFGGTAILFTLLFFLVLVFLLCKWR